MDIFSEYKDILSLLNIIVLTSAIILSVLLYTLYKNISFIIICIMNLIDISITTYNISNIINNNITKEVYYLIAVSFILKIVILSLFHKKLNFKNYANFTFIVGYIFNAACLKYNFELSLVISIILNLFIIYLGIIEKVKAVKKSLIKSRHKLKINKKYISKSIKEIQSESSLNHILNGEIINLNSKIENTIEVIDIPIFILDKENNYIYGNNEFDKILKRDNIDIKKFDLDTYLKKMVLNHNDMMNFIDNAKPDEHIIINTDDEKLIKFRCIVDLMNDNIIKICILEDITYDIKIKEILRESENKYRKLMDILNDGVIIHNIDTVSYINDKALELFNVETKIKKVILIQDIQDKITKKSKEEFMKNLIDIKSGLKEKSVIKLKTEDGKIIEFITTLITLDKTPMMLSMVIDITSLESTKEKIIESEKTYKLLLQALPEGIVIIDKKTKAHTYRNKSMIKVLKYIGVDNFNEMVEEYIEKYDYGKFKRFSIKDNMKINLSMAITDSKEENNLVCVVSILNDEYRAEQMVEKLNKTEDKYKFKTEFLYTVASNLKKPINTIFEVNKVLQNNKEIYNEKYIDNYARVVKQNSYRLKRLLNNIDEISKIENNIFEMNYSRCDVVKFVENIVKLSRNYAKEKNLEILFVTNIKKKIILIDKEKIEKVLLNLLSNSMKFNNNNGKIMVSVNADKESVIISVEDTGVGIPNEKMDSIFENFEQIDTTLSRGAEGTGVGLALVKKIINAHNAKINVYSKVGYGSKFEIILENNRLIDLEESKNEMPRNTDIENIDIEFSDIYFDLGS